MECMICTEDLLTLVAGELDCCDHSFCSECILRWAEKDSRCPACRGRFRSVTEKVLEKAQSSLDCTNEDEMKHSKQMLGKVIKVHDIPERNQRPDVDDPDFYFSDAEDDPMNEVVCVECGGGEDEHNLLLCDGCDCACHTYCANLDSIPEDEWYCHGCTEERERTNQGRLSAIIGNQQPDASAVTTAPSHTRAVASQEGGRGRRTSGDVIDLVTPEEPAISPEQRPRRRLRRLYRRGSAGVQVQGTEIGTTADFLAALEARANSRTAGDAPSHAHRRLENLRRSWGRIRQGHADFNGPVDLSMPDNNTASGQSSSTQVSPDAARPSSRAWAVHASEAEAAFAALDDAMEHIRPSSSKAVAAGEGPHSRGSFGAEASSSEGKRKREEDSELGERKRPAIRDQPRQLRRPQPRERSGLLLTRPTSRHEPTQAPASAVRPGAAPAASPLPRTPGKAGSGHLQRVYSQQRHDASATRWSPVGTSGRVTQGGDSQRQDASSLLQSPDTRSGSANLQRAASPSGPHRQDSGGIQSLIQPERQKQSMGRCADAHLSSVPQRQRAGADLKTNEVQRQPSQQPAQAHSGSHQKSMLYAHQSASASQIAEQPLQPAHVQHQDVQHSQPSQLVQMHQQGGWPSQHAQMQCQAAQSPHGQSPPQWLQHSGARAPLHASSPAGMPHPMHASLQPPLAASHGITSPASPSWQHAPQQYAAGASPGVQQQSENAQQQYAAPHAQQQFAIAPCPHMQHQQLAAGAPTHRQQSSATQLPSQACASVRQDPEAAVQQFEDWYGGLNSRAGGKQQGGAMGSSGEASSHIQISQAHKAAQRLFENEALKAVRPLLKPLYAQELLSRDQFKNAGRKAVQLLSDSGRLDVPDAAGAVKETLSSMGLELAASRVC